MLSKSELASRVAEEAKLTSAQATNAVNAMLDVITESLAKGEEVRCTGFGSFKVVERKERTGRHPRTGEPMKVAGGPRPTFSAGSKLKESVREGGKSGKSGK